MSDINQSICCNCFRSAAELAEMSNRIQNMDQKLDIILQKLDNSIIKNCDKMGDHIDFVNTVYETVKVPLHYISNKIHKIVNPLGLASKSISNAHLDIDIHLIKGEDDNSKI